MLIKRILAYFKAKKEQREHDRKPFYNPADGSVADRRERLVVQRKEKFREAESIYRNDFSASKFSMHRRLKLMKIGRWSISVRSLRHLVSRLILVRRESMRNLL